MSPVDMNYILEEQEVEKKAAEQRQSSYKTNYFEPVEGPNVVRILPPPAGMKAPWVKGKQAWKVGPNKKTCIPRFDETCPLKREIDRLHGLNDEVSKSISQAMYPRKRVWICLIVRGKESEGPKLWNTSPECYREILAIMADNQYGDITNPLSGIDITITYSKPKVGYPEYKVSPRRLAEPLGTEAQIAEWTKENLFEKHSVGKVSEDEWILACLAGTEAAYIEKLKEQGKSNAEASSSSSDSNVDAYGDPLPTQAVVPVAGDMQFWVARPGGATQQMSAMQIGGLVQNGEDPQICTLDQSSGWVYSSAYGFKKKEQAPPPAPAPAPTPAAPPVAQAPPAPAPAPVTPPPVAAPKPERDFFVVENGQAVPIKEGALQQLVNVGKTSLQVCMAGESAWKTPADYGIVPQVQQAPVTPPAAPMPPMPPAAPMSPAAPQAPGGLTATDQADMKEIEALRASLANPQPSAVSQDLKSALGK